MSETDAKAIFVGILLFSLASCKANTAHLSWEDTSDNEQGFRIYKITGEDKIKIAEVGPDITTYRDENATPGACYVVTSFNTAGESEPTAMACLSGSSTSAVAKP